MSPFALTFKSLRHRKFTVTLTVISLALGVALLLGVERIRHEARTSFTNTISGTDLIVGARSGSVSLLLSSVFRIGNPVGQFLEHYHGERNHQGLGNSLIDPGEEVGLVQGDVECRQRLGGLLRYYYRDAA